MTATPFKPGEVLLANYPFTDQTGTKLRPVLVVSRTEFNARGEDFVAVPLTSNMGAGDGFPILESEPWFRKTGLRCSSRVKWAKPFTISRVVVARRLGELPQGVLAEIVLKLRSVFE